MTVGGEGCADWKISQVDFYFLRTSLFLEYICIFNCD